MNAAVAQAYVLVGPTAVGKTAVAQWIAERGGFDILSADSMLFYRGLDVGTAKPTPSERARARYWGVDVADPSERFSAGAFRQLARAAFADAAVRHAPMIVVGGSGLYVKSLTDGLADVPPAESGGRARWEAMLASGGPPALLGALRERAPALAEALRDQANPRRLIRALELAEAGVREPPRSWRATGGTPLTGLRMDPAALKVRIEARVRAMFASGLLEEADRLIAVGALGPTAAQAIGYAEAIACGRGECSREEAIARTAARTRQLAKRQLTWFRHQAKVHWIELDAATSVEEAARRVMEEWDRSGPVALAPW